MSTENITKPGTDDTDTTSAAITSPVTTLQQELQPLFDAMALADEEIAAAQHRHPVVKDLIGDSFVLLRPTQPLMRTEVVYRAPLPRTARPDRRR